MVNICKLTLRLLHKISSKRQTKNASLLVIKARLAKNLTKLLCVFYNNPLGGNTLIILLKLTRPENKKGGNFPFFHAVNA